MMEANLLEIPITLVSKITPAVEIFEEEQSEGPSMIMAHPMANRMRMEIDLLLPL